MSDQTCPECRGAGGWSWLEESCCTHCAGTGKVDMPSTVSIEWDVLRVLFDAAVSSLNFGSGFWDIEDVRAARRVAVLLGLDPKAGTPTEFTKTFEPGGENYDGLGEVDR